MKRRGFLYTLLLPFFPAPQLPWEQPLNLNITLVDIPGSSKRILEGKKALADLMVDEYLRIRNQPSITQRIMAGALKKS